MRLAAPSAALALLAACGAEEVRRSPYVAARDAPVRVVAADPVGGPFADAVADALASRGVAVVPADDVRAAMAAGGAGPADLGRLNGLAFLDRRGADALLTVAGATEGAAPPRRAVATLRRVPDGAVIAEATWSPRWGGLGAPLDRAVGRTDATAATALAAALAASLAR
jgi:hypothetical protein